MPDRAGPPGKPSVQGRITDSGLISLPGKRRAFFTSSRSPKAKLHFSCERYLVNRLCEEFGSSPRRVESSNAGSKTKHRKVAQSHRSKTTHRDFRICNRRRSPCVQAYLL